jgi:hypothetical protein
VRLLRDIEKFSDITELKLSFVTDKRVFHKGLKLVDRVEVVSASGKSFDATLLGTYRYTIELMITQSNELYAECSCPHYNEGNICKHIVATAVIASSYRFTLSSRKEYKEHLNSLTKEELIELVVNFAPESEIKKFYLKSAGDITVSRKEFEERLFKLLYVEFLEEEKFYRDLEELFNEFKYLTEYELEPIFEILEEFVQRVEEKVMEVYEGKCAYYDEDYFSDTVQYSRVVANFFSNLSDKYELFLALIKFTEVQQDYGLLSYRDVSFAKDELEAIKERAKEKLPADEYKHFFFEVLSFEEKRDYLTERGDYRELVNLYIESGDKTSATSILLNQFNSYPNSYDLKRLIELKTLAEKETIECLDRFISKKELLDKSDLLFLRDTLKDIGDSEFIKRVVDISKELIELNLKTANSKQYEIVCALLDILKLFEDIEPIKNSIIERFPRRKKLIELIGDI